MPKDDDLIDATSAPRVGKHLREDTVTMTYLATPYNLPTNTRFQNTPTHDYNHRSHQPNFMCQYLYDYSQVNHVCTLDGKRETVDSLIT